MSSQFRETSLFGGAIILRLPADFIDVSNLRQVPDNQEVYVNGDGLESLTIDITERVEGAVEGDRQISSDLDALKFHAEDIIEAEDPVITSISTVKVPHLPADTPCMTCFVSSPTTSNGKYTGILILLMRLVGKKTDLLVTCNVPDLSVQDDAVVTDQAQLSERLQDARLLIDEVVSSFKIMDWNLFVEE